MSPRVASSYSGSSLSVDDDILASAFCSLPCSTTSGSDGADILATASMWHSSAILKNLELRGACIVYQYLPMLPHQSMANWFRNSTEKLVSAPTH
jgi:hypothetical protein